MAPRSTTPIPLNATVQTAFARNSREKILLIVDDDVSVGAALSRLLGREFNMVLTARNTAEAVSQLKSLNVTHLICDYWLGCEEPQGIDLIPRWRKEYPGIRRAILFTGTDLEDVKRPMGVDRILSKSEMPSSLIDAITD